MTDVIQPYAKVAGMTDDDLMDAHHVAQVRRASRPRSIERRDESIAIFSRSLGEVGLLDASRFDVEAFLDGRRTRRGEPIQPKTRYCWLSHLHGFYEWAIREELTTVDPTARIVRPKVGRTLPRPAATAELESALADASPLHRCWLLLAAYQGLRCQEIAGIRREDVIDTEGLLVVMAGKGGKQRILPIHPDVLDALNALPMPRSGWLFVRPRGGPYDAVMLSQALNRFLRSAGVTATAHQLRHWFATTLYAQTHDIRLTQEMLGHSNMTTTAIYTAFDRRAAGDAVRALNFRCPDEVSEETP